ncbi:mannosyl-oligosaccharide 1,2-alpha-mannosidase IB [Aspergillus tubingensis]|uniref:alpha-1,2-Mannosidase n=1 Tax=Aspergillus tubingensis TaxID=5068 RepID=A0A8H3SJL4_ASPTU|nr:mannosyl-oligosaccharide alpha-1,2-mannosidase [Aspergillus tubingensis]GFN10259.1 mannosyl-oligosaccharide alpha-1,2-mannosidase [Aspergillus tubingensis]GLA77693.1 mannosyl-oligosaccharide 1,2-alpha-mannosidase IB [Aspergillus tubingensis]GLA80272.1 mannosyl-oligosaccharide 1,2-alpha-mannosidase IB [Aspergillus tubingensis]GLA99074.1 mannosyl-oligosaccharide 1,2-alpha-mannosidase IB [Aspergillus tubingensis]GLB22127.1 mannosyl-oligosaccharide 1,2-alpha-mannosidase IB [Aspergillus tubingen
MSFQAPRNSSPFSSQQPFQNNYWRASRSPGTNGLPGYGFSPPTGISNSLNNPLAGDRTLPMYKDKPYFAPRRTGPRARRRKIIYSGLCLFVLLALWYYSGSGQPEWKTPDAEKGAELWKWVQSFEESEPPYDGSAVTEKIDWEARREKVRDVFIVSWDGYAAHAWGYDEYHPIAKNGRHMIEGGMGWIIVDALDTLMIMNLTSRVQHARSWIHNSLQYNQDHDVNTFETTIRMLGGLLSAHYLSTNYPELAPLTDDDTGAPGEDLYIEKATDLADRLLGAFESGTGIPYASINLNKSEGLPSYADNGASSTAEATTLQLEFKYLAKLTGEAEYWQAVEKVMEVVDDQKMEDGLLPIYVYPETGEFKGDNIRLGSRGDSYYEYLIKQYLQTKETEPIYKDMWDESLVGVRKHLITYTQNAKLTVLGERPAGLHGVLSPKMDHLVCFYPGTIALAATGGRPLSEARQSPDWGQRQEEEILLARELTKTCWATYLITKTGLAPEITYFNVDDPRVMETDMYPDSTIANPSSGQQKASGELPLLSKSIYPVTDYSTKWRDDLNIHKQDRHNLQRPETVESLFYMYRITGDDIYRHWGWEMFKSFVKHTAVVEDIPVDELSKEDTSSSTSSSETEEDDGTRQKSKPQKITGFTSLSNADDDPPVKRDNMESFWMAETLKYFYLLFSDRDFISLEEHVFNTEAHPLPRFKPTGELKTGWMRKSRTITTSSEEVEESV